ncbi:hypothetical protein EVAR_13204_1 [Eumeta japonica]|uniref:Uncharacterized protein n=1 Tax=Eumeta variegata TaxID=151549 RepID=A0A4C1TS61_EUMVA|nr:hypothetical protein EVAR_13204_1 [Eumeta japonica]
MAERSTILVLPLDFKLFPVKIEEPPCDDFSLLKGLATCRRAADRPEGPLDAAPLRPITVEYNDVVPPPLMPFVDKLESEDFACSLFGCDGSRDFKLSSSGCFRVDAWCASQENNKVWPTRRPAFSSLKKNTL